MSSRRGGLVARSALLCCLIIALWAWVAWPWLSGHVTIPYDAKAHFQAQIQFLAAALDRGDSPFWTPNVFAGSPQIADPQSLIFSPAFLLALLDRAPSFRMMDSYVLGLLLAGGFAFAAFGGERGWHPAARVMAALVFAFGASASWRLQHVGQVQSLACFAVALWLLTRALRGASWRSGLGAGIAAGLMVVTPDQIAWLGVWLLAAYAAWFMVRQGEPLAELRRAWPALLAGSVVGLVIVIVPLVMTVLFSEVTNRAEIDIVEAARGSLHPASLLTMIVGDLFGAADPAVDYWGPSSAFWSPGNLTLSQNMGQVYVGALPALCVLAWLAGGWRGIEPEARLFLGLLLAMIVYAIGGYTPLFPLIFDGLPGANLFRRPADATFMIGALMALLSGFALDALLNRPRLRALAAGGLAALALMAVAVAVAWHVGRLDQALPALLAALGWLGVSLAALALMAWRGPKLAASGLASLLAAAGLGGLLAADLKANNGPNESTGLPPLIYAVMAPDTDNRTIAYLKAALQQRRADPARRDRVELLGIDFHWPNLGMIHGFDHAFGYNPLHMADFTEATGAKDHMGGAQDRKFTPLFPSFRSTFADMLGLGIIVSSLPIERVDRKLKPGDLKLLARTPDGFIYENPRALPRAMFVDQVRIADFDDILAEGLPAGFDPTCTLLLERLPDDAVLPHPSAKGAKAAKVAITAYENTDVTITVDAATPGYLVLNDVWHPWWTVTVNGEEADMLKANVLFRAVAVGAGKSTVIFSFKPLDGAMAELRERLMGAERQPSESLAMVP